MLKIYLISFYCLHQLVTETSTQVACKQDTTTFDDTSRLQHVCVAHQACTVPASVYVHGKLCTVSASAAQCRRAR